MSDWCRCRICRQERDKWLSAADETELAEPDESLPLAVEDLRHRAEAAEAKVTALSDALRALVEKWRAKVSEAEAESLSGWFELALAECAKEVEAILEAKPDQT